MQLEDARTDSIEREEIDGFLRIDIRGLFIEGQSPFIVLVGLGLYSRFEQFVGFLVSGLEGRGTKKNGADERNKAA
jgi:hypothetical protein